MGIGVNVGAIHESPLPLPAWLQGGFLFAICLALSASVPMRLCGSVTVNVVIRLAAAEEAVSFYLWNLCNPWILL
jgi:hypothetical protein